MQNENTFDPHILDIGNNIREARLKLGWSMRQLATQAEVSPSLISQIENGRTMPSVRTLYSLAEALSLPVNKLIPGMAASRVLSNKENATVLAATSEALTPHDIRILNNSIGSETDIVPKHLDETVLQKAERSRILLQGGITWERLTKSAEQGIEFLQTVYPVGASSGERMSRHAGREFGLILSGELTVEIGFESYVLREGDSITFDSTRPHRLSNSGEVPMKAIWVVWE